MLCASILSKTRTRILWATPRYLPSSKFGLALIVGNSTFKVKHEVFVCADGCVRCDILHIARHFVQHVSRWYGRGEGVRRP